MGKLIGVLNKKDREDKILTTVLKMAHNYKDEIARIIAI